MGFLQRLGQDIAAGKGKPLALVARIGGQGHHVTDLFGGFQRQGPFPLGRDAEGAQFKPRRPLANAKFNPAVREQIEGR